VLNILFHHKAESTWVIQIRTILFGLSREPAVLDKGVYSVQPKVSTRVDRATELGTKISQSEAAAGNVRVMPEPRFVADWPPQTLYSVAPSPRIETG